MRGKDGLQALEGAPCCSTVLPLLVAPSSSRTSLILFLASSAPPLAGSCASGLSLSTQFDSMSTRRRRWHSLAAWALPPHSPPVTSPHPCLLQARHVSASTGHLAACIDPSVVEICCRSRGQTEDRALKLLAAIAAGLHASCRQSNSLGGCAGLVKLCW